ncbi:DUF4124 domain-containing protein [Massilia violaceinigra]|uniref:DUF4124 domain-containing protein n=1 Tax=Massilia violaceinigra TaxID=2045208 RepID=A0ABY4A6D8_9BURK|nr:DUF4124 domain-containing protein [Massilia violaceinigra]UOD28208.1 DUF4124 domain-containing protein [Massilia violaceinigra]
MPIHPFYLALLLAAAHGGAVAQVTKCTDASGRTTYQSTPCAAVQGAREQKMAMPAQKSGSAPAPAAPAPPTEMEALNDRMRVRMCEIHRISLKRLKESDTMLVPNGSGNGIVKADPARRASEIAQAEKRVADTCK